jgi:beta-phosphoglucomutase
MKTNNMERRKCIIFDMDGVLVDAMPFHCKAIQTAAKSEVNIDIAERDVYLLEGMPGEDMIKELLRQKRYSGHIETRSDGESSDIDSIASRIHKRKKEIFQRIDRSQPISGAKELLSSVSCKKALVSGAAKQEVDSIIEKYFGKEAFDVVVSGEDLEEGKPSPDPFQSALTKMGISESEAIVVENAPLGVRAANNAGVKCIVTLNNTPLKISDFEGIIKQESIFADTMSAIPILKEYCNEIN